MSNQPPRVRPWFRLASIRSVPPPSAPVPRPALTIPATFRNIISTPSEPTPLPPSAPAPLPPASGQFAPAAPPPTASAAQDRLSPSPTTRATQPQTISPNKTAATSRGVQSLDPSLNQKTSTPPPSPQTLPPTQLRTRSEVEPRIPAEAEAEPKTVVVQKSIEKSMSRSTKNGEFQREPGTGHNGKQIPSKEIESKEKQFLRKFFDPKDSGTRVITLAGENRGAHMEIIRSSKKHESKYLHNNGGTKTNSIRRESEGSSNEDGKGAGNKDSKSRRGRTVSSSFPMTAFMNSNVQSVNNSIVYKASCEHNDPGVHLALTKKPAGDGLRFKERASGQYN